MRLLRIAGLGLMICLAALTWACGSRTAPPDVIPPTRAPEPSSPPVSPPPTPDRRAPSPVVAAPARDLDDGGCALLPGTAGHVTSVALTDAVDAAHAPHPTNDSERLLFRQLYETLIRVDCVGRARQGLAASWRLDASGRTWIVTLREDARFSDGTPVTTTDVLVSWTRRGNRDELRPPVGRHIESVVPVNDRVLGITLRDENAETPMVLADTNLAVAKRAGGSRWPLGTRLTGITEDAAQQPGRAGFSVVGVTLSDTDAADAPPVMRFVVAPDVDPRDLLDEGVDLLVTKDPAALDYAATLSRFVSVPLGWQRTYVFLSPWRARAAPRLSPGVAQVLANDAVRGEAQSADGSFWWETRPDCELARPQPRAQSAPTTGRIVYRRGDDAARDLAERFIGLAMADGSRTNPMLTVLVPGRPNRTFRRATGLPDAALAAAVRNGADTGYIVSLDRRALDACRELERLTERAGWLDPATIVPLVETRLRAVARRGLSGVTAEWDGGLVISGMKGER